MFPTSSDTQSRAATPDQPAEHLISQPTSPVEIRPTTPETGETPTTCWQKRNVERKEKNQRCCRPYLRLCPRLDDQ